MLANRVIGFFYRHSMTVGFMKTVLNFAVMFEKRSSEWFVFAHIVDLIEVMIIIDLLLGKRIR